MTRSVARSTKRGGTARLALLFGGVAMLVAGTAEAISRNLGYAPQATLAVPVNGKRDRIDYA